MFTNISAFSPFNTKPRHLIPLSCMVISYYTRDCKQQYVFLFIFIFEKKKRLINTTVRKFINMDCSSKNIAFFWLIQSILNKIKQPFLCNQFTSFLLIIKIIIQKIMQNVVLSRKIGMGRLFFKINMAKNVHFEIKLGF